jgi:isoleucyl-tRNA synthetase
LQARQKAGIAVRQPLNTISLQSEILTVEYTDIMKDELNIKHITFDNNQSEEVILDIEITGELKAEGNVREFIRAVQDMRKKKGLQPSDVITLSIDTDEAGQNLLTQFADEIKKVVGARDIVFGKNSGEEVIVDELKFVVEF